MKEQKDVSIDKSTPTVNNRIQGTTFNENELMKYIDYCFKEKDLNKWADCVYNDDDMTVAAEQEWFKVYVLNACDVALELSYREELNKKIIKNKLTLSYDDYESHYEIHEYYFNYISDMKEWKIVKIKKKRNEFPIQFEKPAEINFCIFENESCEWWDHQELINIEKLCSEPDSENIYLRGIARTVLYRGAHPIIECSSIKINMMSVYIAALAKQLYHHNKLHYLANIYNAVKDKFTVSIARSERNNEWSSKLQAPWYSFDELMALKLNEGKISGSCSSYMSFFYAMLKLGGFRENDLIQARFDTQDILFIFIESDIYMISTDSIQKLTNKTFFYKKRITILYTDMWYWTEQGETNANDSIRAIIMKKFEPIKTVFEFPFICKSELCNNSISNDEFTLNKQNDYITLHNNSILKNYYCSISQPKGATTWGKYAYQSMIVLKPNVYIKWSIQCKGVREFIQRFDSFNDIMNYLMKLNPNSIFYDNYRLMTADQVIRYNQADSKAKAVFLYATLKIKYNYRGGVVFTEDGCYCIWKDEQRIIIMNMNDMGEKDLLSGKVLLAMNEKTVFYPLINQDDANKSYPELMEA